MMAKVAIPVIWGMAAALFVHVLKAWNQLPQRVAVHFNASMQPNGWSSRSSMALLMTVVVIGHAMLATYLILGFGTQAGIIAPVHMVAAAVFVCAFWQMINFNAEGSPFQAIWVIVPVLLVFGLASAILLAGLFRHHVR